MTLGSITGKVGLVRALLSGDESTVDSLVLSGVVCTMTLCIISATLALLDHSSWNPMVFAGASATVMAAAGGAKAGRDRWGVPLAPQPQDEAKK